MRSQTKFCNRLTLIKPVYASTLHSDCLWNSAMLQIKSVAQGELCDRVAIVKFLCTG